LNVKEDTIFWITVKNKKKLATLNNVSVNQAYNERLVEKNGKQYNVWNHYRSKLAAAIINGLEIFPILKKTRVLYFGDTAKNTVSHISDIIGIDGKIFVVNDITENSKNFLEKISNNRTNVFTIIYDKNNPAQFSSTIETVDVIYLDITQPNKTEITIDNCKNYLRNDGYLMLVVPTKNIDFAKNPTKENLEGRKRLQSSFDVIQEINLTDFFKEHSMIIAKYLG
jgi:fibrillarin-like pre-rRNA processing protein